MRNDQISILSELEEALADTFIHEADPREWPEDRTDLYRAKRQAMETGALLARVQTLLANPRSTSRHDPDRELEAENVIAQAETRAAAAMQAAVERASKTK